MYYHIVLLCQNKLHMKLTTTLCSVIQQCQVHQVFVYYVLYCNLKEKDHMGRKINSKQKEIFYTCEISFTIILICQKLGSVGSVQQKLSSLHLIVLFALFQK